MRAWPRIVLTRRLSRSVRSGGHRCGDSRRDGGLESTLVAMILSFGPSAEAPPADGAGAQRARARSRWPATSAAALPGERFSNGPARRLLLAGWIAHGIAIVVDIAGIGADVAGRALRLRAGAVGDALAGAGGLRAREPLRRRCPARVARWRTLGVVVVVLALAFPGQLHPQAASKLGAAALAARHRIVRAVRRRRAACACC